MTIHLVTMPDGSLSLAFQLSHLPPSAADAVAIAQAIERIANGAQTTTLRIIVCGMERSGVELLRAVLGRCEAITEIQIYCIDASTDVVEASWSALCDVVVLGPQLRRLSLHGPWVLEPQLSGTIARLQGVRFDRLGELRLCPGDDADFAELQGPLRDPFGGREASVNSMARAAALLGLRRLILDLPHVRGAMAGVLTEALFHAPPGSVVLVRDSRDRVSRFDVHMHGEPGRSEVGVIVLRAKVDRDTALALRAGLAAAEPRRVALRLTEPMDASTATQILGPWCSTFAADWCDVGAAAALGRTAVRFGVLKGLHLCTSRAGYRAFFEATRTRRAEGWPGLTDLFIGRPGGARDVPVPDLCRFLARCPQLRFLSVNISETSAPRKETDALCDAVRRMPNLQFLVVSGPVNAFKMLRFALGQQGSKLVALDMIGVSLPYKVVRVLRALLLSARNVPREKPLRLFLGATRLGPDIRRTLQRTAVRVPQVQLFL